MPEVDVPSFASSLLTTSRKVDSFAQSGQSVVDVFPGTVVVVVVDPSGLAVVVEVVPGVCVDVVVVPSGLLVVVVSVTSGDCVVVLSVPIDVDTHFNIPSTIVSCVNNGHSA